MTAETSRRFWVPVAVTGVIFIILGALAWLLFARVENSIAPDPVSIANASLTNMQEQNRLTVFSASYNATVTTTLTRLGLSARKTLIMPGTVRYELDLAKLGADDVRWDARDNTLYVEIPAIEIARPEVHIEQIQTYDDGGILMALTDAQEVLDQANRKKGVDELAKQALNPMQVRMAREAARRAVRHNFAVPLQAAGVEAKVDAFFPYERSRYKERWDYSRPIRDVLAEQQKKREEAQ
ncbi:DUF4230 domain-containing protein [Sphingorhabdus sp. YGSMI21]|uniref:DUF4230 domain-containing protein n=1 Tax=Sphingorhabdus sp. YGSMI21 TaxID=2077182 RepID=UPI000C1E8D83|nr:DUF4230 domain-containing protein [Sphingorhabdus sp. YGSMI21]ATW03932.1 hypothetical protein CHN51_10630 [Sphingorhabdus sp. YGSMI21]